MSAVTLAQARAVIDATLAHARAQKMMPLLVLVLDARAALKACAAEDGTSLGRYDIAHAKAYGALALGMGSRTLAKRGRDTPPFMGSMANIISGGMVLGPGGVLIRDETGAIIGAVGVSGDVGDNDEAAAVAGIAEAGLTPDPGAD